MNDITEALIYCWSMYTCELTDASVYVIVVVTYLGLVEGTDVAGDNEDKPGDTGGDGSILLRQLLTSQ